MNDWRTHDTLTEKDIRLKRNGYSLRVHNHVYDKGRRQQFEFSMGKGLTHLQFTSCDHHLGIYGHMQRILNAIGKELTLCVNTRP